MGERYRKKRLTKGLEGKKIQEMPLPVRKEKTKRSKGPSPFVSRDWKIRKG